MAFFGHIFHHNQSHPSGTGSFGGNSNARVTITEEGKKDLDQGFITGRDYTVMLALDAHPQTISNLARESRMDLRQTEIVVSQLRAQGRVAVRETY